MQSQQQPQQTKQYKEETMKELLARPTDCLSSQYMENSLKQSSISNTANVKHQAKARDASPGAQPSVIPGKSRSSTGKRKFHSKSRHGCSTCKKRRVKCDEQKPICGNCTKLKLDCGYQHDLEHLQERTSQDPPLKKPKTTKKSKKNSTSNDDVNVKDEIQPVRKDSSVSASAASFSSVSQTSSRSNSCNYISRPEELDTSFIPQQSEQQQQQQQQQSQSPQQQATPSLTPSPNLFMNNSSNNGSSNKTNENVNINRSMANLAQTFSNPLSALSSGLLNAGNLNNLNLAQLVNNISGFGGDMGNLGSLMNLGNLATLAQLPIDLNNLSGLAASFASQNPRNAGLMESISASLLNSGSNTMGSSNISNQGLASEQAQAQAQTQAQTQEQGQSNMQNTFQSQRNTSNNPMDPSLSFQGQGSPTTSFNIGESLNPASHDIPAGSALPKGAPSSSSSSSSSMNSHIPAGVPFGADTTLFAQQPQLRNTSTTLNMQDLKLMFHYTSQVANTITGAGISETNIWLRDIPMLAFEHPFLMHSLLAFSATHLSRTEKGLDQCVTSHRGDALRLLREAVLNINAENTDALVASALILIMDSLANASFPSSTSPQSLPASAWIFHVKGAATILTAVWPLTEASRFYKFISVDLGDLGDIINQKTHLNQANVGSGDVSSSSSSSSHRTYTDLECHDADIADLFPVEINSPYLITLAYLNKLHKERYKSDFILRIFAFPALLDKQFMGMLMSGDVKAMRIMRSYYKLLRSFTMEMKDKVWFLEGVAQVLPSNVEEYAGGAGGMHMMMDFLGGGPDIANEYGEEFQDEPYTSKTADSSGFHDGELHESMAHSDVNSVYNNDENNDSKNGDKDNNNNDDNNDDDNNNNNNNNNENNDDDSDDSDDNDNDENDNNVEFDNVKGILNDNGSRQNSTKHYNSISNDKINDNKQISTEFSDAKMSSRMRRKNSVLVSGVSPAPLVPIANLMSPSVALTNPDNLPSDITSELELMQGDHAFIGLK